MNAIGLIADTAGMITIFSGPIYLIYWGIKKPRTLSLKQLMAIKKEGSQQRILIAIMFFLLAIIITKN